MGLKINNLSDTAWKNLIDTGEIYTPQVVEKAQALDQADSIARPFMALSTLSTLFSSVFALFFTIEERSNRYYYNGPNPTYFWAALAISVIGGYIASRFIEEGYASRNILADMKLAKDCNLGTLLPKMEETSKARLERIAATFEQPSDVKSATESKVYATFFRTLAKHENYKHKRLTDFYDISTTSPGKNPEISLNRKYPAGTIKLNNEQTVRTVKDDTSEPFCKEFEEEIAKLDLTKKV